MYNFLKGMDAAIACKQSLMKIAIDLYGRQLVEDTKVVFEGIDTQGQKVRIDVNVPEYALD